MFVNKVKNGYILLELLIASAISAFLLGTLFATFRQTSMALTAVDTIATIDMGILLMHNQLEKDISGAFVPLERKPVAVEAKKEPVKNDLAVKATSTITTSTGSQQKYEDIALNKAFFSKNKGENIDFLTFITSNPIKSFASQMKGIQAKPRIARVLYRLVQNKERIKGEQKISFSLFRQEDFLIGFSDFEKQKPRSYAVIKNIKKLSAEYTVSVSKEKGQGVDSSSSSAGVAPAKNNEQEEQVEYKIFKQWGEQEIKKTKKDKPDLCTFKVELWDDLRKTFRNFEFKIYIVQGQPKKGQQKKGSQSALSTAKSQDKSGTQQSAVGGDKK